MNLLGKLYIAVLKGSDQLCIVNERVMGSKVILKEGETRLTCEVAPISDFICIEEIRPEDVFSASDYK